jgi:hypothetical protein
MLDLYQAERFFSSFTVRDRRTNRPVPFRFNPSQARIMEACKQHVHKKHRLFVIFLKARRLGISTWARMMLTAHSIEKEYAESLIMAHRDVTGRALYEETHHLVQQLPLKADHWKYTQKEMNFYKVPSRISWQTAGGVSGSRGLTFTMLHATEAAYYENPDVWPAMLNTISDDPEGVGFVETTPNGTEGPGKEYYDLWTASVAGETEFLAQFLPWHEDPEYVRDPSLAKDAPRDEYERFLMRDLKLPRERIAFYRITLKSKCGGKLDRWRKEYPGDAEEAFTAGGDPVFAFDDQVLCETWANSCTRKQIELTVFPGHRATARTHSEGRFVIYEDPKPGAHYFMGVVIGRSDRSIDAPPDDDMLAIVVWNGENGVLVARCHVPMSQTTATETVYALGCYYNRAMVAVEDGLGGYGTTVFHRLRDQLRYPNQYHWKGRNDKADPAKKSGSLGFTFTDFTRRMALSALLTSIRRKEAITSDDLFVEQMLTVQWAAQWRFDPISNYDEVFFAGALGWIAKEQYHPRKCSAYTGQPDDSLFEEALAKIAHQKSPFSTENGILMMNLNHHLESMQRKEQERVLEIQEILA